MVYETPHGRIYNIFEDMTKQPHLLIAGATGSGKSVVINGIITTLLYRLPSDAQLILVDPKRVELSPYKNLPHTIQYASEPAEIVDALYCAMEIVEDRYKEMQARGERKYSGGDVYVIIDEYADLMSINKKTICPLIQRIAQIGRASRVKLIIATQCPLRSIITTEIKCNIDSRVGLRTRSAQDSRNILGHAGLELLPQYGECVYMTPAVEGRYKVPYVSEDEQKRLIAFWETQDIRHADKERRFKCWFEKTFRRA